MKIKRRNERGTASEMENRGPILVSFIRIVYFIQLEETVNFDIWPYGRMQEYITLSGKFYEKAHTLNYISVLEMKGSSSPVQSPVNLL